MADDDDNGIRSTAPKNPDDWRHIWLASTKANRMWVVAAPFVALAENWKALLVVAGLIAALTRPELKAVVDIITQRQ